MRRVILALLGCSALLAGIPAQAFWQSRDSGYNISVGGVAYSGPGDISSGAIVWYGMRGYSAAYAATGTGNSINVRRASDNATQDIVILTNGNFDVASYNTFVGTDATASCTLAVTSMACTGASATIHTGDLVTGTGITPPCRVTATDGSTTATVVQAGTAATSCGAIGVAATVTFQVAGFAATAYDQSGANACSATPCNATQATAGNQPQVLPSGIGGKAALWFQGFSAVLTSAAGLTSTAQPYSQSVVAERVAAFTTAMSAFGTYQTGGAGGYIGFNNSADNSVFRFATTVTVAATDLVPHALNGLASGASSKANVDGSASTISAGTSASGTTVFLGSNSFSNGEQGYFGEGGQWLSNTSANFSAMQLNQKAWWSTP